MKEEKIDGGKPAAKKESDPAVPAAVDEETAKERILDWNRRFAGHRPVMWDRLPDIELYMDQVVTLIDKQLAAFRKNGEEKVITSSMVNNYTKDRVIPRAESKKYSREHVALLMIICSLKKVLSMPDLAVLLKNFTLNADSEIEKFYELFSNVQIRGIRKTTGMVEEALKDAPDAPDEALLRNVALQLAVDAQLQCIAAEQILDLLKKQEER